MDDEFNFINFDDNDDENIVPDFIRNDYNINNNEWEITMKVLQKLLNNADILENKFFREFRSLIADLFSKITKGSYYKGVESKEEYTKQKEIKKNKKRKEHMMKQLDMNYQNSCKLRKKRIEELSKHENIYNDSILLIKGLEEEIENISEQNELNFTINNDNEYYYPKSCYTCKIRFLKKHHFYDRLCPPCAELNWEKRNQRCNLNGCIAILTGGRVKIGFKCGLKLLRDGCEVIITTRFPKNAANRYLNEKDSNEWKHRLHFYGLDLRDIGAVERFTEFINKKYSRLDIIINNAAQTVRRPSAYYKHLIPEELDNSNNDIKPLLLQSNSDIQNNILVKNNSNNINLLYNNDSSITSVIQSQVPMINEDLIDDNSLFPEGILDIDNQQLDLRSNNSWIMKLEDISPIEIIEVHCINVIAPFILNSKLKNLMIKTENNKFIINVSAMEGKFYRKKTPYHPHTNMAKAGLNMMTKTSAHDYSKSNIYMNSVDTGWIHDENPFNKVKENFKKGFQTPIDEEDAAARILDPIYLFHIHNETPYGKFYKDYKETSW